MAANQPAETDSLYSYDSFGGNNTKKKSEGNFLWWCSGAHQKLLREFPSEHSKYAGLGGVLLATFVLAALSAGYAVYSVFGNWIWTICFALIWGLIIFNFDRFLVSTMRKYGVSKRKQLWMAIPRLLLAVLIGVTIARPLELKIFEKEIDTKVVENLHKKVQLNDSLLQIENKAQLQNAFTERSRLTDRKLAIEDTLHRLQQSYVQEADGTGGSGQRGIEDLTRLKMNAYTAATQQYRPELQLLNGDIARQDSIISSSQCFFGRKKKVLRRNHSKQCGFPGKKQSTERSWRTKKAVYSGPVFLFPC